MVKFLVIRFSSIGDIVLTTPVVRHLKKQVENSEIHFLTKKKFAGLLENNPYIDKVHSIEKNSSEITGMLQKEEYDHIIDLHHNIRSNTIKSKLKIPAFTLDKLNFKKWLLVNLKIDKMPEVHIVDRYMDTLSVFDITNDNEGLDYFFYDEANPVNSLPEIFRKGYAVISMGANHKTKRLPANMVSELVGRIQLPVILLGGHDVTDEATEVEQNATPDRLINFCGKYSLNQSAMVLKDAKYVISFDSGMMHIASALKKDIISIWGNTVPQFGMYPYMPGENSRIFEIFLGCRPCSKIGFEKCPKGHFKCMKSHNIEGIAAFANTLN